MNFDFPLKELPAVMRGPRVERRHVMLGGTPVWGTLIEDGEAKGQLRLDDGRVVDTVTVTHLPPVSPSKIIAVHISYRSRSMETRNKPRPTETPTYFTKPPTSLNGHGGQILKPADCKYLKLVPGDVILMGTPCHSRSVDPGQFVECEITGLGRLGGTVVAIDAPRASALGVGHQPTDTPEVQRVALGFDERVPEQFKANLRTAKGGAA